MKSAQKSSLQLLRAAARALPLVRGWQTWWRSSRGAEGCSEPGRSTTCPEGPRAGQSSRSGCSPAVRGRSCTSRLFLLHHVRVATRRASPILRTCLFTVIIRIMKYCVSFSPQQVQLIGHAKDKSDLFPHEGRWVPATELCKA